MVILRLALSNVLRNANRSLLVILGMAGAAAIMTGSMAMRTGYVNPAFIDYRRFMQADVVIFPRKLHVDSAAVRGRAGEPLETIRYEPTFGSDLLSLEPGLAEDGFLAPASGRPDIDLGALRQVLSGFPNIRGIHPLFEIPALLSVRNVGEPAPRLYRVPVRGVDVRAVESWGGGPPVGAGRPLTATDEGDLLHPPARVALFDQKSEAFPVPAIDSEVRLYFPSVRERDGRPTYDWSDLRAYDFTAVGTYFVPTGMGQLWTEDGQPVVDQEQGRPITVPTYWDVPDVLVPSRTLALIYGELGGTAQARADQVGISVDSMYLAKQTASELQKVLPDYGIYTVPDLIRLTGGDPRAVRDGAGRIHYRRGGDGRMILPADLSSLINALSLAIAGLLAATNMFILVAQRRHEIGVLRAIGASSREIFALILVEVLVFAVIGSLAGFLLIRLGVTFLLFFSAVSLAEAGRSTLLAAAEVVGLATLAAALFGLLPAWEAARSTTVEVLRHE